MKCCRFCQADILEKSFEIKEPSGEVTFFCEECGEGLIRYITSGEAEKAVEARISSLKHDANDLAISNVLFQTIPAASMWGNTGFGSLNFSKLIAMLDNSVNAGKTAAITLATQSGKTAGTQQNKDGVVV